MDTLVHENFETVPQKVFLTRGVGRHKHHLISFEDALRHAGVAHQNLVQVSSILPPKCKIINKEKGLKELSPGGICYCVMARADTNEHGRLIATSIGVALPKDDNNWGYLSEVHGQGINHSKAAYMAEDLAAGMLVTTLGFEVDPNKTLAEKEQIYKSSGLIMKTTNITQTTRGRKDEWTTALAIAVFLFE